MYFSAATPSEKIPPAVSRAFTDLNAVRQRNGVDPYVLRYCVEQDGEYRCVVKDGVYYDGLFVTPSGRYRASTSPFMGSRELRKLVELVPEMTW